MKYRILITTLASVMFIGGIGTASTAITNTQTVQAATPSFDSSYWTKNRRVYVTKNCICTKIGQSQICKRC